MNKITTQQLHVLLKQFQVGFRLAFPKLTDQDYAAILAGEGETLLTLLQARYGYTPGQVKEAWNDFVLRIVDGPRMPMPVTLCSPADRQLCCPS